MHGAHRIAPPTQRRRRSLGVAALFAWGAVFASSGCANDRPVAVPDRSPVPVPTQKSPALHAAKATPSATPAADASSSAVASIESSPPVSSPLANRPLDPKAVERLVHDARANSSDELVLVKDGAEAGDWRFTPDQGPIQTMSITKSILSLAVGTLIDRGKLRLQEPVYELYPEWSAGKKREVTLFHLLTHTSGLDEGDGTREIYRQKSFVEFTLDSDIVREPGTHFQYSNRGANLVSGIVARASGLRTDRYVDEVLFHPLGIERYSWSQDRSGQPEGLAGLHLLPRDLAKIGELLLEDGTWKGKRIVSREWLHRSLTLGSPTQPTNGRLGLYWWLIPEWTRVTVDESIVAGWRAAGVEEAFIERTRPIQGRRFDSVHTFVQALRDLFGDPKLTEWADNTYERDVPDAHFEFGPVVGAYASGTLGQYLVVLPRDHLVAVRMRREPKNRPESDDPARAFPDFVERVQGLVQTQRE